MILRYLSIFAVVLTLGACSNNDENSVTPGDVTSPEEFTKKVQDRVFFGYDRYDLVPEAKRVLDAQIVAIKGLKEIGVLVEGHCDERGTREYNIALGDRRANSVKKYMTSKGVDASIKTVSYGKEYPEAVGSGESVWSQNRRAVTVLTVKGMAVTSNATKK